MQLVIGNYLEESVSGFFHCTYATNLCLGCDSVGHELITRFLVSVTQLSLNILFGKRGEEWVSGKR